MTPVNDGADDAARLDDARCAERHGRPQSPAPFRPPRRDYRRTATILARRAYLPKRR